MPSILQDKPSQTIPPRENPPGYILVADDEALILRGLERVFQQQGWKGIFLRNPHVVDITDAFEHHIISACLLDLVMPSLSGQEAARVIRQLNRHVPIVFMSGYADCMDQLDFFAPCRFMAKPFSVSQLTAVFWELGWGK